jgi:hypothetical protein
MRLPRVELHRRHRLCSALFVLKLRGRICSPRSFFIASAHRARWR